jgi:hypothetical protein
MLVDFEFSIQRFRNALHSGVPDLTASPKATSGTRGTAKRLGAAVRSGKRRG